jgi:phage terminase Nu1 subunit (DNA packaging protein)
MANVNDAAQHIDIGRRRFFELVEEGAIERKETGEYDLDAVRVSYIRHLRKVAAGRAGISPEIELSVERAKLAREQTETAAFKNAIARGEYVLVEEVGRQVEEEYAMVRQINLSISGVVADAAAMQPREVVAEIIDRAVAAALAELSAPSEIAGKARNREK